MRLWPHQICLRALRGEKSIHGRALPAKAEAAAQLKQLYGQDFGEDAAQWGASLRRNWRRPLSPTHDSTGGGKSGIR